jgi:hypothetical protein
MDEILGKHDYQGQSDERKEDFLKHQEHAKHCEV